MDDKTLALLGDRDAQERLTERGEFLPCRCRRTNLFQKTYKRNGRLHSYICCVHCGSTTNTYESEKEAIRDWNTRVPILTLEQIERLQNDEDGKNKWN